MAAARSVTGGPVGRAPELAVLEAFLGGVTGSRAGADGRARDREDDALGGRDRRRARARDPRRLDPRQWGGGAAVLRGPDRPARRRGSPEHRGLAGSPARRRRGGRSGAMERPTGRAASDRGADSERLRHPRSRRYCGDGALLRSSDSTDLLTAELEGLPPGSARVRAFACALHTAPCRSCRQADPAGLPGVGRWLAERAACPRRGQAALANMATNEAVIRVDRIRDAEAWAEAGAGGGA